MPFCMMLQTHPVVFSLSSGKSCLNRSQGIWVMMPAPSPESLSAEHAPRCSMHPREVRAWMLECMSAHIHSTAG